MGKRGNYAPSGLKGHELKTLFLRAPFRDWAALVQGHKAEFRAKPTTIGFFAPTPVVLYCVSPELKVRKEQLMVLASHRCERLMDIAEQPMSLRCEGFEDYEQFRHYWRQRERRPFRAMEEVQVFCLAPWTTMQAGPLAKGLLRRLYGDYLPSVDGST